MHSNHIPVIMGIIMTKMNCVIAAVSRLGIYSFHQCVPVLVLSSVDFWSA